jgi:transposase-like protein
MHAVRAELQRSKASVAALAEHYGINPKTVLKWRRRASVQDSPMGPKAARPTVLTLLEEAAIVAFRQQTPLPLDDVLFALQPQIPHLTRSSLHRLLERHGISRLPKDDSQKTEKKRFKRPTLSATSTSISARSAARRESSFLCRYRPHTEVCLRRVAS